MATLVFGSLGSMLGGPLGGAIGSLVGRQFDAALFGSAGRQGPRLKELAVTTSSYGQTLPRHFGRMRTAGSVIWATDLVERSEAQGSGKGGPSLTTYAYSVSFAVALASRPIRAIGRIWADGKLLRGAAGDLKAAGTLRVHTGAGDQQPDPLIVAAEGPGQCPAYRGLAYVVFEDLDLSGFYNRIPSLTFEIIADDGFSLRDMIGEVIEDVDADLPFSGLSGYTSEGSPAADLQVFDQITPLEIDAAGEHLVIAAERRQEAAICLPEPAIASGDGDFGALTGFTRHRAPPPESPPSILRYYDVDRDHQPSLQRATGRSIPGEPAGIDLPAALDAGTARALIERTARRIDWNRDRISWRTCELDPRIGPGTLVTLPGIDGHWRVREWEWRDSGVELHLERALPPTVATTPDLASDPGRPNPPLDTETGQTRLVAFELPFDAATGSPDAPRPFAAVSATSAGWSGAALYADHGDGALHPLGPSGRMRATIGTVASPLPPANPLLFDRTSCPVVMLVDPAMQLAATDTGGISRGANLALIGEEIVQFLGAVPIGAGRWRLEGLLRGRAGTETAIAAHRENEDFVLLDNSLVRVDASTLGSSPGRQVVALGRGDDAPATASLHLDGIGQRPLAPVHPRMIVTKDDGLLLSWTRRARGGWAWQDGVDVPLVEQAERYLVTLGPLDAPLAMWTSTSPTLDIDAATVVRFATSAPHAEIHVRQQGTHALSLPLLLGTLS
ncbi:phage tail protein [Novosphingobium kaempferiae]|uniref:GTA baseplate fiber-binding domain-containing protein n=1 Tax=Novosphingobium kaempferiae TaxID=2896849 RepID=UPI001E57B6C9|nr:phage tail protein [Novosphingobium kaempferiae]